MADFVQPKVPCIIRNAIPSDSGGDLPNPLTLSLDDIVQCVGGDAELTVDVTPDGHGDCIRSVRDAANDDYLQGHRRMFVKPHEKRMTIEKFRTMLRRCEGCDYATNGCHETSGNVAGISPEVGLDGHRVFPLRRLSGRRDEGHHDDNEVFFGENTERPPVVYYSRQVRSGPYKRHTETIIAHSAQNNIYNWCHALEWKERLPPD